MNIGQLNKEFSIKKQLKFIQGKGRYPFISAINNRAQAVISLYGGQVLSFRPNEEEADLLFLSKKADYQGNQAIRGGIPICWPWFGDNTLDVTQASHGFARNNLWSVAETSRISNDATKVQLKLELNNEIRSIWPQDFELIQEITIAQTLTLDLVTRNTGNTPFCITQAFHSYFLIGDIRRIQVKGLESKDFLDKLDHGKEKHQSGMLTFSEETDRIYTGVHEPLVIVAPVINRQIKITSTGAESVIVWNPWSHKSTQTADLESGDYQHFICVEVGNAATDQLNVKPGTEHRLHANFKIMPANNTAG